MYGVTFNSLSPLAENTLTTYGLALMGDLAISSPEQKTNYIDVPGMDGCIDASDAPQGYPVYGNRTISFSLYKNCGMRDLNAIRTQLMTKYHGKQTTLALPTDSGAYWSGRFYFGELASDNIGVIPVSGVVYPYALEDGTFNEDTTMTTSFKNLPIHNMGRRVVPVVRVSATTVVQTSSGGTAYTLTVDNEGTAQEFILPELEIPASDDGTAQIVATWRVKLAAASSYNSFWVEYQRGHL